MIRGSRIHAGTNGPGTYGERLYMDAPLFAEKDTTYQFDIRNLLEDPDNDPIDITHIAVANKLVNGNSGKIYIGGVLTDTVNHGPMPWIPGLGGVILNPFANVGDAAIYNETSKRYLEFSLKNSSVVEFYNEVKQQDTTPPGGKIWGSNGAPTDIGFSLLVTDGQLRADGLKHRWETVLDVRPDVYPNFRDWQNATQAPEFDSRPWYVKVEPSVDDRSVTDNLPASADYRVEPSSPSAIRNYEGVGNVAVDLVNGTMTRTFSLPMDASGGSSELAIQGLMYDSATIHADHNGSSTPLVQVAIHREAFATAPTSIDAELTWLDHRNIDGTPESRSHVKWFRRKPLISVTLGPFRIICWR